MDEKRRRHICKELKKATFKIIAKHRGEIGTGFFISSDGYFLTAYHCVENKLKPDETCFHLKLEFSDGEARTDDFMLLKGSNKAADLAVFKSTYPPPGFVPLGLITAEHFTHRITAPGFPAVHKEQGKSLGFYEGTISRFNEANKEQFETDAIQGTGHSGGPVYDYDLDRVVGLVQDEMSPEVMKKAGLALRFDALFEKWPELKSDNEQVAALWDRRIRDDSESEKDKDKDEAKTGCGRIIPKLCNRREQRAVFWNFFSNACPDRPHFYFIHGSKGEGHISFIERMGEEHIKAYAKEKWREENILISPIDVRWPAPGDMEVRKIILKQEPLLKFHKGYAKPEYSFSDLQALCSKNQFLTICHNIDVSKWGKQDEKLLEWYMKEWAEFEPEHDIPRFLIFFNLKYPRSRFFRLMQRMRKIFRCHCFSRECFHELAENMTDRCPCLPEIKLEPITSDDLEEWFEDHGHCVKDPKKIEAVLKKCKNKTAEEIEGELKKIVNL